MTRVSKLRFYQPNAVINVDVKQHRMHITLASQRRRHSTPLSNALFTLCRSGGLPPTRCHDNTLDDVSPSAEDHSADAPSRAELERRTIRRRALRGLRHCHLNNPSRGTRPLNAVLGPRDGDFLPSQGRLGALQAGARAESSSGSREPPLGR